MGLRRRQRQSGGIASSNLAFVRASRRASRSNHPGHYRNNRNETQSETRLHKTNPRRSARHLSSYYRKNEQ